MFSSEPYRAKAAEFRELLAKASHSPDAASEFRDLERIYTTLAENEEWMAVHVDRSKRRRSREPSPASFTITRMTSKEWIRRATARRNMGPR
jgi:hypothetical protein